MRLRILATIAIDPLLTHCSKLYELLWPSTVAPAREATSAQAASRHPPPWARTLQVHFSFGVKSPYTSSKRAPFRPAPIGLFVRACTCREVAAVSSRTCRCSQYRTHSCQVTSPAVLPLESKKSWSRKFASESQLLMSCWFSASPQLLKAVLVCSPRQVSSVSFSMEWRFDFAGTSFRN